MNDVNVAALVAALESNPRTHTNVVETFEQLRGDDARSGTASDLLDELAKSAVSNDQSLETLLSIIITNGLARPAIRRILISAQDVEDAEQRTLASVALGLGGFEQRSRFTTWLHTVASNEAKMLVRSRSRRPEDPTDRDYMPEAPFLARLSTILGDRDLVERALAALPDDKRQVLVLRDVEGLDYQEISDHLDIPIGTVRSRLSRAREALAVLVRPAS